MPEPFHTYHARRAEERALAIPTLDAPATRVRLRRRGRQFRIPATPLALGIAAAFALLLERFSA